MVLCGMGTAAPLLASPCLAGDLGIGVLKYSCCVRAYGHNVLCPRRALQMAAIATGRLRPLLKHILCLCPVGELLLVCFHPANSSCALPCGAFTSEGLSPADLCEKGCSPRTVWICSSVSLTIQLRFSPS